MRKTGEGSSRVLLLLAGLCFCTAAHGSQVTAVFEGPVASIAMADPHPFSIGDVMRFSLTFESTTPDVEADSWRGLYYCVDSLRLTVRDAADALIYSAFATDGRFIVENDVPLEESEIYDTISFLVFSPATSQPGTLTGPDIGSRPLWMFSLSWIDYSGTALDSDALPTSFASDNFDRTPMSLAWRAGPSNHSILVRDVAATTSVVSIPAPAALVLCSLGTGLVGGWRKRRTL